jgi:hypothetical protein
MKLLPQKVPYFRRAAIMTSGPAPSPRSSSVEMTTVNSFDLPEAQDATRWHPESDWLVDLDKHPGLGMPDTDNRRPLTELESGNAQPLRDRRQCSGFFDRSAITGVESVRVSPVRSITIWMGMGNSAWSTSLDPMLSEQSSANATTRRPITSARTRVPPLASLRAVILCRECAFRLTDVSIKQLSHTDGKCRLAAVL